MVAPLPQVVHEEPEHVAVEQVGVVQAVLVTLPLVLLYDLGQEGGDVGGDLGLQRQLRVPVRTGREWKQSQLSLRTAQAPA